MSDDIVKRLRETGDDWPACLVVLENEAADEIERLRAELAAERELREREKDAAVAMLQVKIDALASERKAKTIYYDEWQDANNERDALREQLAEAREALEPFAKMESSWDASKFNWMGVERYVTIGDMRRARAVFGKIKGGGDE